MAIDALTKALELRPDNANGWYDRAVALAGLGRFEEAIPSYDRALAINPKYASAYYDKGSALAHLGRDRQAIEAFDMASSIDPNFSVAYFEKGLALARLSKNKDAIAAFDAAIGIDPSSAPAFLNKGRALANLKKFGDAVTAFDSAIGWIRQATMHGMPRVVHIPGSNNITMRLLPLTVHWRLILPNILHIMKKESRLPGFTGMRMQSLHSLTQLPVTIRNRNRIMRKALHSSNSGVTKMLSPRSGEFLIWTPRFRMLPITLALQRNAKAGLPKR